jgi:ubiquinone biosynthesis protein UbiJ
MTSSKDEADATLRMPRAALPFLAGGSATPEAMAQAGVELTGDVGALPRLLAVLSPGDPHFAMVTPEREDG